jgi:hypothetical protein
VVVSPLTQLAVALTAARLRHPGSWHRYTYMSIETYISDQAAGVHKLKLRVKYQRASREFRRL